MIAPVASFEGVDVAEAQRTMDEAVKVIRPLMEGLAGFRGYSELVSPNGKVLVISLFDSEENARVAEPTFDEEMPRRMGDLFRSWGGRRVSVDLYEVVEESRR